MAPPEQTSDCSSLLIYQPRKDERLSWPNWLTCSGRFTHITGHSSDVGWVQDMESLPAKDRHSTTVPRPQPADRENITMTTTTTAAAATTATTTTTFSVNSTFVLISSCRLLLVPQYEQLQQGNTSLILCQNLRLTNLRDYKCRHWSWDSRSWPWPQDLLPWPLMLSQQMPWFITLYGQKQNKVT